MITYNWSSKKNLHFQCVLIKLKKYKSDINILWSANINVIIIAIRIVVNTFFSGNLEKAS